MLVTDPKHETLDHTTTPYHYLVVRNLSALLKGQESYKNGKRFYCMNCLNGFNSEGGLQEHSKYCSGYEKLRAKFPKPNTEETSLEIKGFQYTVKQPFIIYADTEAFPTPINTVTMDPNKSSTVQVQKHKLNSYCIRVVCSKPQVYNKPPVLYRTNNKDEDVAGKLITDLEVIMNEIGELYKNPKNLIFENKDKIAHAKATKCYVCKWGFDSHRYRKTKSYCSLTEKYIGAAHYVCNLKTNRPNYIPIVFHNLEGYDSHMFVKSLGLTEGSIDCIPKTDEKYISFSKSLLMETFVGLKGEPCKWFLKMRFIDSFKFMSASLETLVKNMDKRDFHNMNEFFPKEQLNLLLQKGVYPYEYMTDISKFSDTKLPTRSEFFSKLCGDTVSEKDYLHAQNVWKTLGFKNLGEYHDTYLKTDVLLLADIFENFRGLCLEKYGLDPAHFFTAPGLAWNAALKITGIELELITDPNMYLFIEKGIRGGVSTITHRYSAANSKYMKNYDPTKESKYIEYLDANNLYGWAMSQKLPISGFKWVDSEEYNNWKNYPCILEVDMDYPKELHDLHKDLPLAPESVKVNGCRKLIPTLCSRNNYVIHHNTLRNYIKLGLKLTKIHKVVTFKESPWLEKYIMLNTKLRTLANNDFEKYFFKLMNNSVFGKTMENLRNRVDVKLVSTKKMAMKLIAKSNYKSHTIFSEDLVAIHMEKTSQVFNKPIYLGMTILDLSKTLMYNFHYEYIKKKYNHNATLLMTDTDSLCYEIKTNDFYKDISGDVYKEFDTSNYPKVHPSGIPTGVNKKVIGLMKDEAAGKQITEFVGLRAKMYSHRTEGEVDVKKCKGIKKNVVKNGITFQDYKDCLNTGIKLMKTQYTFRSRQHDIFTEQMNKTALSANDDKRVILNDLITTLPYGHYKLDNPNFVKKHVLGSRVVEIKQ